MVSRPILSHYYCIGQNIRDSESIVNEPRDTTANDININNVNDNNADITANTTTDNNDNNITTNNNNITTTSTPTSMFIVFVDNDNNSNYKSSTLPSTLTRSSFLLPEISRSCNTDDMDINSNYNNNNNSIINTTTNNMVINNDNNNHNINNITNSITVINSTISPFNNTLLSNDNIKNKNLNISYVEYRGSGIVIDLSITNDCGSIFWEGLSNVTNINLYKVICITEGCIIVYEREGREGCEASPVRQGLNRQVVIKSFDIFPKEGMSSVLLINT